MSLPPQVILGNNGNGVKADVQRFQIWQCTQCERERQWGVGRMPNRDFPDAIQDPLLNCFRCDQPTRHTYSRLVFSRKDSAIDFGDSFFTW